MKSSKFLTLAMAFLALTFLGACKADWYVKAGSKPGGNGKSWRRPFTNIQEAIDKASSGDVIFVAEGTYYRPSGGTDPVVAMKEGVEIYGGFIGREPTLAHRGDPAAHPTILNGEGQSYHVVVGASSGRLDGFIVTGGVAKGSDPEDDGGWMHNYDVHDLEVADCVFTNNSANGSGGGMRNKYSTLTVTNCAFTENSARYGGGMANQESDLTITGCAFRENTAGFKAGGMYNGAASPTIDYCTFTGNKCRSWPCYGGGMNNYYYSSPTITNSVFSENHSNDRAGVMENGRFSSPAIKNCLFIGNTSGSSAAGIFNLEAAHPTITNCTFTGNSARNEGGAIYNYDYRGASASPTITNCILWGNVTGYGNSEIHNTGASSPVVTYSNVEGGYPGAGNIGEFPEDDPLFAPGPDGDYYLSQTEAGQDADSPCLDAGADTAENLGMDGKTTSAMDLPDSGDVDMGFHYEIPRQANKKHRK